MRALGISILVFLLVISGLMRKAENVPGLRPLVQSMYTPQQIRVRIVREMTTSYSFDDVGKGFYGFDGTGGFTDPANGTMTFADPGSLMHMWGQKMYPQYYPDASQGYPGQQGQTILVDLTGGIDFSDTTNAVTLSSIWAAGFTYDAGDSMVVYDFTPYFRASIANRWLYIARCDSMLTPLGYLATKGGGYMQWSSLSTSITTRYLLFRIIRKNRGAYYTIPDFNKVVIYGNYNYSPGSVATIPDTYTGPYKQRPTFDQFVGTNLGQGVDTLQTAFDGRIRVYWANNYLQKVLHPTLDTLHEPGFPDIGIGQYPAYNRHNQNCYLAITGGSSYLESTGYVNPFLAVDAPGTDPRNPASYVNDGIMYYNYAAYYGSVNVSTANTIWYPNTGNGNHYMHLVQNGNELDSHGVTLLAYWARSVVDRDGWENRIGVSGRMGLKNADPNFKLIMAPTTYRDTNFIYVQDFFARTMTTSGNTAWDIWDFHLYNRSNDSLGYPPSSDQQVGEHGESPAKVNMSYWDNQYVNIVYKLRRDTVDVWKDEFGYGNWGTVAPDANHAAYPWDIGCVPPNAGLDSLQLKAIFMAWCELRMGGSYLTGSNEFFFHNSSFGANNYLLFSSYGRTTGRDITTFRATVFFPWWYVRAWLYNNLKGYYWEATTEDSWVSGGRTIQRWRSRANPLAVKYVAWREVYIDTVTLQNQSIPTGLLTGTTTASYLSFTDSLGTTASKTPAGGYTNVGQLSLKPMILSGTEANVYISNRVTRQRNRIIIKKP
jgi:hypothetical protein